MAHKRFRNNAYHYTITSKYLPSGRVYLTFDNEVEGDHYVKQLDMLLAEGIVPNEFKNKSGAILTISNAIDSYINRNNVPQTDQDVLKVVRDRVGHVGISKLNYDWAEKYVSDMKLQNLAASTIRHHVGALSRCLDWLKRTRETTIAINPLRELPKRYASGHREEFVRDRRLSGDEETEVRRILLNGKPKNKQRGFNFDNPNEMLLLFDIAIETGMRLSEIYTLEVLQIDLECRTIFLDKTKNGDSRQVPISSVLMKILKRYMHTSPAGKVFSFEGTQKTISAKLSQTFGLVFEAAGCGEFTFHGLRHEATSRLYERTKLSDLEIAKILGWRSLRVALRYANLRGSNLSEKLW